MTPMLFCGIPSEPPLALAIDAAGEDAVVLNQRAVEDWAMTLEAGDGGLSGVLRGSDGTAWPLDAFCGVYVRLVPPALLPDTGGDEERLERASALFTALSAWLEVAPCRVANRSRPSASNASKPLQAQVIARCGFDVPPTLVTSEPDAVRAFLLEHRRVVYKSISGTRSIVCELRVRDAARLERVRALPTQFQALVPGTDVRVHTVGEAVFATEIASDATDYRYAGRQGGEVSLRATTLPDDVAERCLALSAALGLEFSGIDLRRTPDGRWCCFEVNPSPAYSYYQQHTGQPIADALVRHLSGVQGGPRGVGDRELGGPVGDRVRGAPAPA